MPPPKSSKTCNQCRARKVKCNGSPRPGPCANCDRLSFECSFASHPLVLHNTARPERRRGPRACIECRSQKSKCSGELPSCGGCLRRGKGCVYPETARNRHDGRKKPSQALSTESFQPLPVMSDSPGQAGAGATRQPHPPAVVPSLATEVPSENAISSSDQSRRSPSSFNSEGKMPGYPLPLPPIREQLHLIIDFFRHVYPLPVYSFLSEVSITQRCLDQTMDKTLLLSICAVSALQLKYAKYHPVFTSSWIKQAENIIWDHMDQPNIFRTQALVLIVRYRVDTGAFQKAYMLSSITTRAASALRLQYERTDLSPLAQEIRRRLMWCLAILDGHFSMGLVECEMCPFEAIYLQLPCKEEDFNADRDGNLGATGSLSLDGVSEDGLLSLTLRETIIRRDVMKLKRQISLFSHSVPQLEAIVAELNRALQGIQIPPYSAAELQRYAKSRWLVRYLAVQLSWHQCYCDIYRHFLPGYPEAAPEAVTSACSPPYIAEAASMCLRHAQSSISILNDLAATTTDLVVADVDIAICGYHASRLMLFLSRSALKPADSDLTPEIASTLVKSVLSLLKRLFSQSKLVKKLIFHLEAILRSHTADEEEEPIRDLSDLDDENETRGPRFALAAKEHQRLGVHSVLRLARFVDDSHDAASELSPHPRRLDASTALPSAEYSSNGFPTITAPLMSMNSPANFMVAGNSQSSIESMTAASQFLLDAQPFNFGSAGWSEFYLPHDFSAFSDGDYF